MCYQGIEKRQEGVDGIQWRTTVASVKTQCGIGCSNEEVKNAKVRLRSFALMTAHQINGFNMRQYGNNARSEERRVGKERRARWSPPPRTTRSRQASDSSTICQTICAAVSGAHRG